MLVFPLSFPQAAPFSKSGKGRTEKPSWTMPPNNGNMCNESD